MKIDESTYGRLHDIFTFRAESLSYSLFFVTKTAFPICLLPTARQRSSQFLFRPANHITAKKGASKISKGKGANSLANSDNEKNQLPPNDSFSKEPNPRNEKNQKLREKPKAAKEIRLPRRETHTASHT
jgi:hypothetical protein